MKTIEVRTCYGHQLTGIKGDHITKIIQSEGLYEKQEIAFLISILKKIDKPVFLDVGANIGNHALSISRYVDKMVAFEPITFVYDVLCKNIKANALTNIDVYNLALSASNEEKDILINMSGNIGNSTLESKDSEDKFAVAKIKAVKGDDFFKLKDITDISMIKIDVEGHELHVLEGLKEIIRDNRPFIELEWNNKNVINGFNQFFRKNMPDYKIYFISLTHEKRGFPVPSCLRTCMRYFYASILGYENRVLLRYRNHKTVNNVIAVPDEKSHFIDKKYMNRWLK